MALINLEGEREATTQNSEEYGKKVIEFLNLQGHHLEHDSNIEGCFQDKIFRNRKIDGDKKTVVEVKDTSLSLLDKDFLREYGANFKINLKEEFNFFIFARHLASLEGNWKKIFDLQTQKESILKKFFSKVKQEMNDEELDYEQFKKFVNSTKVYQCSYNKLYQKIEQIKRDNVFDSDADYLKEDENLVYKTEELNSNIYKVTKFPQKLYVADLKSKSQFNNIWNLPTADKYVQEQGKLYSVRKIPHYILEQYCDISTNKEINFSEILFEGDEKINFIKRIIRSYIICKSSDEGCYYYRKNKLIYFPHKNLSLEKQKKSIEGEKQRYVSKVLYKENGEVNFVLHRALKFKVVQIRDDFFVIFDVFKLFTTDGTRIISGESARKIDSKFPPTKSYNNEEKSKLGFLIKSIGLFKYDFFHKNNFLFKQIKFSMPCKAEFGEIFNENFDYEEKIYPTLKDYFDEEDESV